MAQVRLVSEFLSALNLMASLYYYGGPKDGFLSLHCECDHGFLGATSCWVIAVYASQGYFSALPTEL